ncbi:MAG: PDZ domain-containing protein, partial [Acetatifactor sp.]|nr:PDZ domain-containing protein [Acetatifactor sp.]
GAYVDKVAMDSPAMRAGIQRGDVITGMNDTVINTYRSYSNALLEKLPNETVEVAVMRQVQQGEYREMSFSIELGEGN